MLGWSGDADRTTRMLLDATARYVERRHIIVDYLWVWLFYIYSWLNCLLCLIKIDSYISVVDSLLTSTIVC